MSAAIQREGEVAIADGLQATAHLWTRLRGFGLVSLKVPVHKEVHRDLQFSYLGKQNTSMGRFSKAKGQLTPTDLH